MEQQGKLFRKFRFAQGRKHVALKMMHAAVAATISAAAAAAATMLVGDVAAAA